MDQLKTVHSHLGELAALSDKTQATERRILARARQMLAEAEKAARQARPGALAGRDDDRRGYLDAVDDQGRLKTIIAQAESALGLTTAPG